MYSKKQLEFIHFLKKPWLINKAKFAGITLETINHKILWLLL